MTNSTLMVPYDVVEQILFRLPVRPLLKFRSVSKTWNTMIFSHEFAKIQLKHSKSISTLEQKMLFQDATNGKLKHIYLHSLLNKITVNAFDIDNVLPFSKEITWVGSCDGLICLALDKINVVLWNPCTLKFKKLPDFEFGAKSYGFRVYGFGFDKSSRDYKVLGFDSSETGVICQIYSLKADRWKSIEINNEFHPKAYGGSTAFAYGKLWILVYEKVYQEDGVLHKIDNGIGYFDMETEEHGILKTPDHVRRFDYSPTNLVESGGCLYVFSSPREDVWKIRKIKGFGVGKETWTKIVSMTEMSTRYYLQPNGKMVQWCSRRNFNRLMHVGKNGEMVFFCRQRQWLVMFNRKDCYFRYLDIGSFELFMVGIYVESLLSPLI